MKRLLGLSVIAMLFTGLTLAAQEKSTDLYPLKVGSKWTYKVPGGQVEVKVEKMENVGGEDQYKLDTSSQGKVSAYESVVVKSDGVYRVSVNGLKPDVPIKFLSLPAKKGDSWDVKATVQGQTVEGKFIIKEEDVTVPFGTFKNAILVDGPNFKIANMETTLRYWFVKDIGIVKLEFKIGVQDATLELEKYEPGK